MADISVESTTPEEGTFAGSVPRSPCNQRIDSSQVMGTEPTPADPFSPIDVPMQFGGDGGGIGDSPAPVTAVPAFDAIPGFGDGFGNAAGEDGGKPSGEAISESVTEQVQGFGDSTLTAAPGFGDASELDGFANNVDASTPSTSNGAAGFGAVASFGGGEGEETSAVMGFGDVVVGTGGTEESGAEKGGMAGFDGPPP
eukprot:CAMPEP_0181329422 /NCGR_PEP_ID=MMETSP1101-20121128/23298_1 /TAXON_ID=46948 /ORGANISM="Rhodomonas abbreviata, Strain Caron Lab Isolate" /LENGTH=197 /DNA_ID=CAMNT_0023438491 /DNA_START=125 /DNA_END=714 /DNA_ORIENTATION=+